MKQLILIIALLAVKMAFTQTIKPYPEWLTGIKEITVTDSIYFDVPDQHPGAEDPGIIKSFFYPLYTPDNEQTKQPATYHVTGKITSNADYDIVLLYKYKWHSDSLISRQLFMNTMSKSGKMLHFQLIAQHSLYRNDQTTSSCWFFKPGVLKVATNRTVMGNNLLHTMEFIINHHGVIVAQTRAFAGN
jgi:hypothetical protein